MGGYMKKCVGERETPAVELADLGDDGVWTRQTMSSNLKEVESSSGKRGSEAGDAELANSSVAEHRSTRRRVAESVSPANGSPGCGALTYLGETSGVSEPASCSSREASIELVGSRSTFADPTTNENTNLPLSISTNNPLFIPLSSTFTILPLSNPLFYPSLLIITPLFPFLKICSTSQMGRTKWDGGSICFLNSMTQGQTKSAQIETLTFSGGGIERRRRTSTLADLCAEESGNLERMAPGRPSAEVNSCRKWMNVSEMPSELELEELFSAAEKDLQKRFSERHNFDIVKGVPLEGCYEWVHEKP